MAKLWGGRFTGKTDPLMEQFNCSLPFDCKLAQVDIRGSQAYARALSQSGLITAEECKKLVQGLEAVGKEWSDGTFVVNRVTDEDIHTANERRLGELIGTDVSGKLHTGRSRNDQVATDMRLWLREECLKLDAFLREFIACLVERAEKEMEFLMPGYTHLQRAQPIRWSHFLLAYAWSFHSDWKRLRALLLESESRASVRYCPLGSGALAGNPFAIQRSHLASELGFEGGPTSNSLHAVGDRDFIADFLYWSSMVMLHLSRLSEDFIIYSSAEFGFLSLADAYSTGSSLMPQKKNSDSLELLRGKCGRVFGDLAGFLMTYKGLPSTYNKDLQEDKEPMFDAAETLSSSIQIASGVVSTLRVDGEKMRRALTDDMLATDVAEYLVRAGMPFRQAHHKAGEVVRMAEDLKCGMSQLTLDQLQSVSPLFQSDMAQNAQWWNFERSVESRAVQGGTSRKSILDQIAELRKELSS